MNFLALRYLFSRKKQTILTLLGILLGTAGFVTISGLMRGFQTFIIDQLINNDSHIRISSKEEFIEPAGLQGEMYSDMEHVFWVSPPSGRRDYAHIEYPQGWFDRLDRDERVQAYTPQILTQAIFRRAQATVSVRLYGTDVIRQERVTSIEKYMRKGSFAAIGRSGNHIVLGDGLAKRLGAQMLESVQISVGKGEPVPFKVVGIFHLGVKSTDEAVAFAALNDVQRVNLTPSQITDVAVRLVDVRLAKGMATSWAQLSPEKVQSWDQSNSGILSVFKTQDIVRYSMTIAILIVAAFGIYNVLNIMVSQKKKEIAILRSIGFDERDITWLFVLQGILLGAVGGVLGMGVGHLACRFLQTIEVDPDRIIGSGRMMVSFEPRIYVFGFLLAFASAVFASFLPARGAGRMMPIEIIRTEGD